MWKLQVATNLLIRFILILVFTAQLLDTTQALSDKRLCADEHCKEIISLGIGKINYRAGAEGMVSFKINSPIRIKSKSAGKDLSLWGIEVNGREGYAPKEYIRETKIKISEKNLKYIVDVNPPNEVPILSTSEKPVVQENIVETTTTKPLSSLPTETTEKPVINNNLNENLTTETPTKATPVLSEIVDGTPIPIISNDSDGVVETVNEEVKPLNRYDELEEGDYDDEDDDEIGDYDEDEEDVALLYKEQNKLDKDDGIFIETSGSKSKEQQKEEVKVSDGISENKNDEKNVKQQTVEVTNEGNQTKIENVTDKVEETENKKLETEPKKEEKLPLEAVTQTPQVLSHISEENTNIPESLKQKEIPNISNDDIDNKANDKENPENSQSNEENIEKIDQQKEEKLENVNNQERLEIPANDLQKQPNVNEENKLDTNDTATSDNTNLNVETDNTIEPNNNSKDNDHAIDNSITANKQEFSESDTNINILNSSEAHLKDVIKNTNESAQQKDIKNNENSIDQQEYQTESSSNVNTAGPTVNNQQLPIDTTNNLSVVQEDLHHQTTLQTEQQKTEQTTYIDDLKIENSSETPQNIETSTENQHNFEEVKMPEEVPKQQENVVEQINPTTYSPVNTAQPYNEIPVNSAQPYHDIPVNTEQPDSHYNYNYQEISTTEIPPNDYYAQQYHEVTTESSRPYYDTYEEQTTVAYNNIPTIPPETTPQPLEKRDEYQKQQQQPNALPSSTSASHEENKENKGLFATIMGTVNNVLSINKKHKHHEFSDGNELDRILFSNGGNGHKVEALSKEENLQYCKKLSPNGDCPRTDHEVDHLHHDHEAHSESSSNSLFSSDLTLDLFLKALASKILELSELLAFLVIAAAASLFFIFGYYCFCNSSREGALLSKLNQLESSLLATHKENSILKHNLMSTRQKLASIEDNSFGSNDMVVSLKKELEEELMEKARLQEQITVLQKELENAADAGIELNKIVAELLSNQTGDESIISSVEELQKQLNEQQHTILEINASLAEKSRENSELQLLIAEQNARYEAQIANIQRDNDELEHEKGNLITKLDELKNDFDKDITAALEGKNFEIKRLQNEIIDLSNKVENEHTKWQTSVAKIEALEECLKNVRKDPNVNITEVIDVANVKAQLIETQKKYTTLKERLEIELDQRKLSENQLQILSAEVEKLKQDFNQSEKDKLEAQTRLEVLSNYFKDKENQLQKELSLKEAMWLKQQGETTTTVDRVTAMQEEIQSLKSQNDALRAEIEAQVAAHKAQTGTLENRAHETWLAARQADRRYEEARAEATALRRKLTALAGGNVNEVNKTSAVSSGLGDELPQAPSPIHMEPPGSPLLGRMPPPPFLPPPFMGPPPPFMGMPPPPPFVPPGEMRPAPLGRIMSPPPQRSGRFSPQHLDYEDYLDYEGNNTWHRHTYSPPPRTYRSLSPTDSRYNYGTERDLMSTYDTETDFSPPPSPRESRRRVINSSERIDNNKSPYGNNKKYGNKGLLSSGSEKSYNSPSHHDTKSKKGNGSSGGGGGGGKNLV